MNDEKFDALLTTLSSLENGPIKNDVVFNQIKRQLINCWSSIRGGCAEKTQDYKVSRIEALTWHSPFLRFVIERHGLTVCGSTRGELHHWCVDTNRWEGTIENRKHRQLVKMGKRIPAQEAVDKVIDLVISKSDDACLEWSHDRTKVRVYITRIIPDIASQRTVSGRRRKFRELFPHALETVGWRQTVENSRIYACEGTDDNRESG